jgi:hypothetical protein
MSVIADVAQYLQDQGLGTLGTNIWYSYLPDSGETGIAVLDTGGMQPDHYIPTKEPTFQILVRAPSYSAGKAVLDSIRAKLHQKANLNLIVGGQYFYFIMALSEGGHIGRNARGQDEFSMNFQARTR